MANNMLSWALPVTKLVYTNLATKDPDTLYFIEETGELFKGDKSFTEPLRFVDALPTTPAKGVIYLLNSTLAGSIWDGAAWKEVIHPVATALTDAAESNPVSGDAVKAYVLSKFVEAVGYDSATNSITYNINGTNTSVALQDFFKGVSYDGATGNLSFTQATGDPVVISLPKDNFVKSGTYDEINKQIVLTLQDNSTVTIPATDLVNLNTFKNTSTVTATKNEDNSISMDVKVSSTAGNALTTDVNGLFVQESVTKVDTGKVDEIITANADGTMKTSGTKVGGATLAVTPNSTTVATEAAVEVVRSALAQSVTDVSTNSDNTYVAKTDVVSSVNEVSPSTTKVASEAALVSALMWQAIADVINGTLTASGQEATKNSVVCEEYILKDASSVQVSLASTNVIYIKLNGSLVTPTIDTGFWLPKASVTGTYNVEVKTIDDKIYQASIAYTTPA